MCAHVAVRPHTSTNTNTWVHNLVKIRTTTTHVFIQTLKNTSQCGIYLLKCLKIAGDVSLNIYLLFDYGFDPHIDTGINLILTLTSA